MQEPPPKVDSVPNEKLVLEPGTSLPKKNVFNIHNSKQSDQSKNSDSRSPISRNINHDIKD